MYNFCEEVTNVLLIKNIVKKMKIKLLKTEDRKPNDSEIKKQLVSSGVE